MYVKGKLLVDGQSYTIKNCHIHVPGPKLNPMGIPISLGGAPEIKIKIDRTEHSYFFGWHYNIIKKDHVELVFNDARMEQKSRRLDLYDVQCVSVQEYFSNDNSGPDYLEFKLVPAIFVANGLLVREMNWKTQSWESIQKKANNQNNTVEKEEYTEFYIVNDKNQRIEEVEIGQKIEVVIKSTGKVGKTTTICLNDEEHDFLYNGVRLKNDAIRDYTITKDIERIQLTVIQQETIEK